MKQTKKILCLVLAVLMFVSVVPTSVNGANAYTINGKTIRYTDFSSSPDDCWNYANNIYNKIWGQRFNNSFSDSNNSLRNLSDSQLLLNATNLKNYISHAALGSCLRICNADYLHGTDGWGHSQIIVQKDSNGFTVFEGGLTASPHNREKYYTWSEYCNTNWLGGTYRYIKYIKWPGANAYNSSHSHSYLSHYEADHPHRVYNKCSCGDWYYTGGTQYVSSCSQCNEPTKIVYPTDGGIYKIASGVGNNMYLDFACTNDNIQIYENCDGHSNPDFVKSQYYKLTHVGDGWYTIINTGNGLAMDVYDWNSAPGTNISQYSLHKGDNQLFRFYDAGNGYCYIKSKLGTYVDVQNGDNFNNTNVWAYSFNGSNAQKWKLQSHSHSYTSKVTTAATCTKTGVKTFTCYCGVSYTETIAKTSHSYSSKVTKAATCTATGVKTYTCSKCSSSYTETIAKTAHNSNTIIPAVSATCTKTGLTEGKKCSACGTVTVAQQTVAKKAHSYTSSVTTQPTCTKEGVKTYKCSGCTASYTEAIAKKSHTIVVVPAVSTTCIKTGLTEGKKCSVCGTVTVAQQTIATVSHIDNNSDYKCDYGCGYAFEKPADPTPDEPENPYVPSEPTDDCSCNCHKGGIVGFFFKIINFFQKLFGMNKVCTCGVKH